MRVPGTGPGETIETDLVLVHFQGPLSSHDHGPDTAPKAAEPETN